jgi:hypothetical protein
MLAGMLILIETRGTDVTGAVNGDEVGLEEAVYVLV